MPHTRQGGAPDLPRLLTTSQFAHKINRHPGWVRRAQKAGRIPAAQNVGGRLIYPEDALIRPLHVNLPNSLLDIGIPQEFLGGEPVYMDEPEYFDQSKRKPIPAPRRGAYLPNLRNLREERGLSQYALAKKAGMAHTVVRTIELGHMGTPKTIMKLAKALEVEYVEMMREVV
jgi:DNA-binding XRE family transcriptional regulator